MGNIINNTRMQAHRLLRESEKYFKTDMIYLAKGGGWFGLGTSLSWLISFGTALAFANLISRETFGAYQYVLSVVGILGITALSGMGTAVARSSALGKDGDLYDALREKVKWGFIGGISSIFVGVYYFSQGNSMLGWAFVIAGICIPFWEAPSIYINYAQGKKRFDISSVYDVAAQLLAGIAVIAALFFSKNLIVILISYLLGWGIGRTIMFAITIKKLPPNKERDPKMLSYGKHLTVMSALNRISMNADTIILWHSIGAAPIAAYVFAQSLPLRIAGLSKFVDRIAFPKMATQDMMAIRDTLPRKVLLLCGIATVVAIVYAITAPYLFKIFFPKYLDAVFMTRLLALLIALQPLGLFLNPLTAHAKQKLLYVYNFITPLLRIAVYLALIPPFGILGAVSGLVIMKALDGMVLTYLFYRT